MHLTDLEKKAIAVLKLLPLEAFNKDPMDIDAAEFVDNASEFIAAMDAAKRFVE